MENKENENQDNNNNCNTCITKKEILEDIIEKQNKILAITESSKEKLNLFNDMASEQIIYFQQNSKKYAHYLSLVKYELFTIHDLIKKINKEIDNQK